MHDEVSRAFRNKRSVKRAIDRPIVIEPDQVLRDRNTILDDLKIAAYQYPADRINQNLAGRKLIVEGGVYCSVGVDPCQSVRGLDTVSIVKVPCKSILPPGSGMRPIFPVFTRPLLNVVSSDPSVVQPYQQARRLVVVTVKETQCHRFSVRQSYQIPDVLAEVGSRFDMGVEISIDVVCDTVGGR